MTVTSNKVVITVEQNGLNITINGQASCNSGGFVDAHVINVNGYVTYNGQPLANQTVYVGFCAFYDPTTQSLSGYYTATTDSNGYYAIDNTIVSQTPSGDYNCLVALTRYNGQVATAKTEVKIPFC